MLTYDFLDGGLYLVAHKLSPHKAFCTLTLTATNTDTQTLQKERIINKLDNYVIVMTTGYGRYKNILPYYTQLLSQYEYMKEITIEDMEWQDVTYYLYQRYE